MDPRDPIRTLIITDCRLHGEGLTHILSQSDALRIVGWTPGSSGAIQDVLALRPAVVLLEARGASSPEVLLAISAEAPETRVIVYDVRDNTDDVIRYAELGAAAFVVRDAPADHLVAAILSAACGEFHCSPRTAALMLKRVAALAAERRGLDAGPGQLTLRELQVLRLVDEGFANKEIARQLGIQLSTVKNHVHNILGKVHARRRSQASARARAMFRSNRP